jgi:hypothetical protein
MVKALTLLLLMPALAGELVGGVTPLAGQEHTPAQSVNWGGDVFSTPADFAGWLRRHGIEYEAWAVNHRNAAARLENRAVPAFESRAASASSMPSSGEAIGVSETVASPVGRQAGIDGGAALRLALLGLAFSLVAIAGVPISVLQAAKAPVAFRERRIELGTAGIAILIGVAVAHVL